MVQRNARRPGGRRDGDAHDRNSLRQYGGNQTFVRPDNTDLERLFRNFRRAVERLSSYMDSITRRINDFCNSLAQRLMASLVSTSRRFDVMNRRLVTRSRTLEDADLTLELHERPAGWTPDDEPNPEATVGGYQFSTEEENFYRVPEFLSNMRSELNTVLEEVERAFEEITRFVNNRISNAPGLERGLTQRMSSELEQFRVNVENCFGAGGTTGSTAQSNTAAPPMEEPASDDSASDDSAAGSTQLPTIPLGTRRVSGRRCRNLGQVRANPRYAQPGSSDDPATN